MSDRSYLFSLRIGHALREAFAEGYGLHKLGKDLLAGITVGIIAIPLAMALAIASGVPPQYGLYTAIIAGFVIALTGGSRYSISGPTAAFVVILYPVALKYGLSGLLMATVLSGFLLLLMAAWRLGRLIEYIPESVTSGFTGGIAVVIATLQIKDVFGLSIANMPEHYVEKISVLLQHLPQAAWPSVVVAALTLATMLLWPKLKSPLPAHLPALFIGTLLALLLLQFGFATDTIGSRFSYIAADGSVAAGIPPYLPNVDWPWLRPGPDGEPLTFSWQLAKDLLSCRTFNDFVELQNRAVQQQVSHMINQGAQVTNWWLSLTGAQVDTVRSTASKPKAAKTAKPAAKSKKRGPGRPKKRAS